MKDREKGGRRERKGQEGEEPVLKKKRKIATCLSWVIRQTHVLRQNELPKKYRKEKSLRNRGIMVNKVLEKKTENRNG